MIIAVKRGGGGGGALRRDQCEFPLSAMDTIENEWIWWWKDETSVFIFIVALYISVRNPIPRSPLYTLKSTRSDTFSSPLLNNPFLYRLCFGNRTVVYCL